MSGIDYTSPAVHKSDLQKLEAYTNALVGGGGGGGSGNQAGFSYVNTTTSLLSIPLTLTKVPISFQATPTVTYSIPWKHEWDIPTAANNRFVNTSNQTKRFDMHCEFTASIASTSAQIYVALYKNNNASAVVAQTIGSFGAINPCTETFQVTFPITAINGDFFEFYVYGQSTGASFGAITPSPQNFSPAISTTAIKIECRQVNIQ